jgi:hypothetical protein
MMSESAYINEVAAQTYRHWDEVHTEPCAVYRPKLSIDGDQWCALYGEDLQSGVCGFGKSPELAMLDFNRVWWKKLPEATA